MLHPKLTGTGSTGPCRGHTRGHAVSRSTRSVLVLLLASMASMASIGVHASDDETLGGGSDIRGGALIVLTSGTTIGPIHHVFADNPGTEPINVEFLAEAPPGIEITPDLDRFTIQPGTSAKNPFSIAVRSALPPGDYPVTVQLARSDITAEPGTVTNVPAVGTSFTVRVIGASAVVTIEVRSIESGLPVDGTFTLALLAGTESPFEVGRSEGSSLTQTVAPGRYRASYTLGGRELASQEAEVAEGETVIIGLDVNTVSFVFVSAQPIEEGGSVVVADLTASVDNHLEPIDGDVTIHALVYRDDQLIDTAILQQANQLALGVTEATLSYRPQAGFQPGGYRFEYELLTNEFTLRSPTQPAFTAAKPSSTNITLYVAFAAATAALIAAISTGAWLTMRPNHPHRRS